MQRVYQYLKVYDNNPEAVNEFTFQLNDTRGDQGDCLRILIKLVSLI